MYEAIGGVMPIMSATKDREEFPTLLAITIGMLTLIYIVFAELCYYTFGSKMDKPIIMEMMPAANPIIIVVKFLFILNLVFSYPLTIFVTNIIAESYTFSKMKKASKCRKWLKNLQRSVVLLLGIILALYFRKYLDKVLSLCGCILGTTVVMTFPVLAHYKLLAKTTKDKVIDITMLVISVSVMIVVAYQIINKW